MKNIWLGSVVLLIALVARPALADEAPFGQGAWAAVAVERLFGYSHLSTSTTDPGGFKNSQSQDLVTLLGGGSNGYGVPRLGIDLFVGSSSISLGASAFFGVLSPDSGSSTVRQFNPRVGALAKLSRAVAIWPRFGFNYLVSSSSSSQSNASLSSSFYGLTLEAPLLIATATRVAVVITPVVDLGLGGSVERNLGQVTQKIDQEATQFSLVLGFLMFL